MAAASRGRVDTCIWCPEHPFEPVFRRLPRRPMPPTWDDRLWPAVIDPHKTRGMPVCVDCERWSPGTFRTCPDCSGTLTREPSWATADAALWRLDYEAKWWHRRARAAEGTEAYQDAAWARVAEYRRDYNALRLRLLPVLEAQDAQRRELYAAAARAAGVTYLEYMANLKRQRSDRVRRYSDLERSRGPRGDLIPMEEYERQMRDGDQLRVEAEALALGLSVRDFEALQRRESRALRRLYGSEGRIVDREHAGCLTWFRPMAVISLVVAVGLVPAVVLLLVGRSP